MANILPPVEFATITGRFMVAGNDSDDPGAEADIVPAKGKGSIIPSVGHVLVAGATPPATVKLATVYFEIDSEGYICDAETKARNVEVIAPSEAVNPSAFTYRINFDGGLFPGFDFYVVPGSTIDLTDVGRVATSVGVATTRGEPGVGIESMTLSPDQSSLVVIYDNLSEQTVEIPALGEIAQQAQATTDEVIAAALADPNSATRAAGNATYAPESGSPEYAPQQVGPRERPRVRAELRPILNVVDQFPKRTAPFRLIAVEGTTWWAWGSDCTLRKSTSEGRNWIKVWAGWTTGHMSAVGMWVRTNNNAIITTWHPADGSSPSLIRSTDNGATWATVRPSEPGVGWLGPTNVCVNPVTGTVWAGEYTATTNYATNPTYRIWKSTDHGATWTVFKTIQRDPVAHPETAMFHCHGIQVDPFTGRVFVANGDAPANAGIYRITADETDWEPVATNRQLGSEPGGLIWGGAVGLMFFPDYIAWAVDQSFTSGIVRVARADLGKTSVPAELTVRLNSTGFYAASMNADHTEWMVSASNEGRTQRIDNAIHFYRVADQGATVDEVAALPVRTGGASDNSFFWAFPLSSAIQTDPRGISWWGTNTWDALAQGDPFLSGTQMGARLGWGTQSMVRPDNGVQLYNQAQNQSSGYVPTIPASGFVEFGTTPSPNRKGVLYLIDVGVQRTSSTGGLRLEICDAATGTPLVQSDGGVAAMFFNASEATNRQLEQGPYFDRFLTIAPGTRVVFRLRNTSSTQESSGYGYVTYAWGR